MTEHQWLQRLVGEWTYEGEAIMKPGGAPMKSTGTESVRPIGDVWILGEGLGKMPDGKLGTSILTLGYDPAKKRFVGSWIGSMMSNLWIYDGAFTEENVLTLDSEGPGFTDQSKIDAYRDTIELRSDDHRILSSAVLADGNWLTFMAVHYRRNR